MAKNNDEPGLTDLLSTITDRVKDATNDMTVAVACVENNPGDNESAVNCILSHMRGEDTGSKIRTA
jgi:hypothetical protein